MEFFGPFMAAGIAVIGLAVVVFFIIAIIQEGKRVQGAIRWAYFYAVSLIGLAIVVGSVTFLLNQLLISTVLPKADQTTIYRGVPPTLFFSDTAVGSTSTKEGTAVTCDETCTISGTQRRSIDDWKQQYKAWQTNTPTQQRSRNIVNALSFFLIAVPLFLIHFLWILRHRRTEQEHPTVLHATYFYTVAIIGLLMIVISASLLVNLGLKTVFLDETASQESQRSYPVPLSESASVESLLACEGKCEGLTDDDVAVAKAWTADVNAYKQGSAVSTTQRDLANNFPLLLIGIPLFWYHFAIARKEPKDKQTAAVS